MAPSSPSSAPHEPLPPLHSRSPSQRGCGAQLAGPPGRNVLTFGDRAELPCPSCSPPHPTPRLLWAAATSGLAVLGPHTRTLCPWTWNLQPLPLTVPCDPCRPGWLKGLLPGAGLPAVTLPKRGPGREAPPREGQAAPAPHPRGEALGGRRPAWLSRSGCQGSGRREGRAHGSITLGLAPTCCRLGGQLLEGP